jgi:hypothetical protein
LNHSVRRVRSGYRARWRARPASVTRACNFQPVLDSRPKNRAEKRRRRPPLAPHQLPRGAGSRVAERALRLADDVDCASVLSTRNPRPRSTGTSVSLRRT